MIAAGRCHIRRRQATSRDGTNAPYKRGVTGSNPVAPTKFWQLGGLFETLIGDPVTTAGNHRCMLPDGEGCPRAWQHLLRPPGLMATSTMFPSSVCRPCRCNVTTSPSARGGSFPPEGRITTSRIRPMVRPSLSSSGRPLSLDVNIWRPVMPGHLLPARRVWPCPGLTRRSRRSDFLRENSRTEPKDLGVFTDSTGLQRFFSPSG